MNLLFDFLNNAPKFDKQRLETLAVKGRSAQVFEMLKQQTQKKELDREAIEKKLQISSAHFDKITSQLLSRCYEHLFGNDKSRLLEFLSHQGAFVKHFYQELKRQTNFAEANYARKELAEFYKNAINLIHFNMPIIHKDEAVLRILAVKYLAIERNKNAKLLIECKLMYVFIDKLFAAARIKQDAEKVRKQIDKLGPLPDDADEELTFAYWWLNTYFFNATENFDSSLKASKEAIRALKKFNSPLTAKYLLRMELKVAELNYYLSNFEEAFEGFEKWMNTELAREIPDSRFYATKHLQICLITGNLVAAKRVFADQFEKPASQLKEIIAPRDIISFAKYYLFNEQYDQAFDFIQLGFAKNPKGKYFQYEVELRNMQTAYFFLTKQKKLAVQMCNKHIKYLRSHNYGVRVSDFPYFYILTKAIYNKTENGKKFNAREQDMLNRYQIGSYAVYGRLLLKMLNS
jgi:hypothetical protein